VGRENARRDANRDVCNLSAEPMNPVSKNRAATSDNLEGNETIGDKTMIYCRKSRIRREHTKIWQKSQVELNNAWFAVQRLPRSHGSRAP
jgi:hypothetical protein